MSVIIGFFNELLVWIEASTNNSFFTIIVFTLIVKFLLVPLSHSQFKFTLRINKVDPILKKLKKSLLSKEDIKQKTSEIYKEHNISPTIVILQFLFQIPVLILVYTLLQKSPVLATESSLGWLNNPSTPDPYFILPIIFGITLLTYNHIHKFLTGNTKSNSFSLFIAISFSIALFFLPSGLGVYFITQFTFQLIHLLIFTKFKKNDVFLNVQDLKHE